MKQMKKMTAFFLLVERIGQQMLIGERSLHTESINRYTILLGQ
jgi:hypothetical protein